MKIYRNAREAKRFLNKTNHYAGKFKVQIEKYALMENHFHFLIFNDGSGEIEKFMQKLQQSYAMYFNVKNRRRGAVFGGRYKSKEVSEIEYLIEIRKYISNNPLEKVIKIITDSESEVYSSGEFELR